MGAFVHTGDWEMFTGEHQDHIYPVAYVVAESVLGMLMGMKRFTKVAGVNVVVARRKIADHLIDANKYNL
jgi:hypothetical protein